MTINKKVLIVEDEKMLGEMYRDKFLQAGGMKVFWAESAEEAIELVRKVKPDLILLDILLPRTNGLGFSAWIKKDKKLSSIPIIAFSNYDDPNAKKEAKELGVKEYLIKTNYTPQEIVKKVKFYLNGQKKSVDKN